MTFIPPEALAIGLRIAFVVGGTYLGVCAVLWALQERMIFHPRSLPYQPDHPAVTSIGIENDNERLRGWIVNEHDPGPLIVYFGGNAEEVSGNIPQWAALNTPVVLMNYRGFGESTGKPTERNLVDDAKAVVAWARQRCPERPLVLFGVSLGSGVATLAADDVSPDALIIVSPYRSVEHIARARFPVFPIRWLLRHPFNAEAVADAMPRTLAFASRSDQVIPFAESSAMVHALGDKVVFHTYGLAHNEFLQYPPLWDEVRRFLDHQSAVGGNRNDRLESDRPQSLH